MFGIPYRVYLYYVAMSTYPFRALDMSTKRLLSSSLNYLPVSLAEGTVGYSTSLYVQGRSAISGAVLWSCPLSLKVDVRH